MRACASTNCISMSTPTSSARVWRWSTSRSTAPRFTPAMRAISRRPIRRRRPNPNIALFTNTTNQPDVPFDSNPVKPERSNYYDVGVDQTVLPGLTVGVDAYYKDARDMIDDGQFGAGRGADPVQLCAGLQRRRRSQGQICQRRLPGLCELLLQHHQSHRRRFRTNICSTPGPTIICSPIGTTPTTCSS